jgi:transposase-like protein
MRGKNKFFTDDLKLKIVQEWLNTDVSQRELKEKYGIVGNDHFYQWMCKFGLSKPRERTINIKSLMSKETVKTDSEKLLELKVRQLEKDLEFEKLQTSALDKMIDIAERDLNIAIRKKAGTRQ